jgi:hypothetical protein
LTAKAILKERRLSPFRTFTTDAQMIEDTPDQYQARMQKHVDKILGAVAQAAQAAGVTCETVQVEHEHPYRATSTPRRQTTAT